MSREEFVQAHRTFRLAITVPALNGTHVSLAALCVAAQAALSSPAEPAVSSPHVTAKSLNMADVIGFEIAGMIPGVAGTARAAFIIADGLSAANTIDQTRAKYVGSGVTEAPPAINDINGVYLCAIINAPFTALVTLAAVVRGA